MGRFTFTYDWITGLLLLCLGSFGLFVISTIEPGLFVQQFVFFLISTVLLLLAAKIDAIVLWWFAPYGYIIGTIFLALSYLGPSIRGATRWILIGGQQFQPSELAKPLFLLAFAYFLTKYPPRQLKYVPLHLALFTVPFLLIFKQPDLGTSIVYGSFFLAQLLAGGFSVILLLVCIGIATLSFPLLWSVLAAYQKSRIETFLNPTLDPRGAGYNAIQAMIAVGSGQLFGRGLGRGTQSHLRFLPEHHTDFIFATLVEELGFMGGLLLLVLYLLLLLRVVKPLFNAIKADSKAQIYAVGLFGMLLSQTFVNAGMNMGLIPITGITLPLVSYGGSSLLSTAVAFGFLWAAQRTEAPQP